MALWLEATTKPEPAARPSESKTAAPTTDALCAKPTCTPTKVTVASCTLMCYYSISVVGAPKLRSCSLFIYIFHHFVCQKSVACSKAIGSGSGSLPFIYIILLKNRLFTKNITLGLLVFTPKTRFFFRLLVFTPKRITLYMGLRQSMFYARFFFGLLVFTPKRITLYMGLRQYMFYARSSF